MKKFLKKEFKSLIRIAALAALLFGGPATAMDKSVDKEAFEKRVLTSDAYFTFVRVETVGHAEALYYDSTGKHWAKAEGLFQTYGSGTVVFPGWVITAAHVVVPQRVDVITSRVSSFITKPWKVTERFIHLYDYKDNPTIAWLYYIDENADVALLRYVPRGFLKPLDILPLDFYDSLTTGDVLATVVHKRNADGSMSYNTEILWGHVVNSGTQVPTFFEGMNVEPWFSLWDFTTTLPIRPGDSGSLVFTFMDGEPFFIGVVRAFIEDPFRWEAYSYAAWLPPLVHRTLSYANPQFKFRKDGLW